MGLDLRKIDRKIEHVGVSGLRKLDRKRLRSVEDKMIVIQDHNEPLAVLLSYEKYLIIQDQLEALMNTVEVLNDPVELEGLLAGLAEASDGKTKSIEDIRRNLKR